jgi:hypothetical protein
MFSDKDYWKAIILYGLNAATYKIALGKTILTLAEKQIQTVSWELLSETYFYTYLERLTDSPMPQLSNPQRKTVMERIIADYQNDLIDSDQAVSRVGVEAFQDVVPRFQTIGTDKEIVRNRFYEFDAGKSITIKDSVMQISEEVHDDLMSEIASRWSLLEAAFLINRDNFDLENDIRQIYLKSGYGRKDITSNRPFLSGYQNNQCFYCGQVMSEADIHVDHVLPRQVIQNDEIWNLVLSHEFCNGHKSDKLVGSHYIEKLIKRNENIMGSNHPWKQRMAEQIGNSPADRKRSMEHHYDNVKSVLGSYYWGGVESYDPETDPFYKSLITVLNNSA